MPNYLTYTDVLDHLADFAQGCGVSAAQSVLRKCVLDAYDEVATAKDWSFLRDIARIQVKAAQTTGTLSYDNATRIATLSGATWPSWSDGASLYLDGILCDVERRLGETGDTTAYLDASLNPGKDLTAVSYTLFRRWYELPSDFLRTEGPVQELDQTLGTAVSHIDLLACHDWDNTTGTMQYWAIGPNPSSNGMALYVYPALLSDERIDIPYRRRPRDLRLTGLESAEYTGSITIAGTAVTGVSTSFSDFMEGAILRTSNTTASPKGLTGTNPYQQELVIRSVESTLGMTLNSAGTSISGKGFRVADYIDLSRVAWPAVFAVAESHYAMGRGLKQAALYAQKSEMAIRKAKAADSPSGQRRVAGSGGPYYSTRLKDYAISSEADYQ